MILAQTHSEISNLSRNVKLAASSVSLVTPVVSWQTWLLEPNFSKWYRIVMRIHELLEKSSDDCILRPFSRKCSSWRIWSEHWASHLVEKSRWEDKQGSITHMLSYHEIRDNRLRVSDKFKRPRRESCQYGDEEWLIVLIRLKHTIEIVYLQLSSAISAWDHNRYYRHSGKLSIESHRQSIAFTVWQTQSAATDSIHQKSPIVSRCLCWRSRVSHWAE